jgi:Apea-like HEPN
MSNASTGWCAIAPVSANWSGEDLPSSIDLGAGVTLIANPPWARSGEALDGLDPRSRTIVEEDCEFALRIDYDPDDVTRPDEKGKGVVRRSIPVAIPDRAHLASLSVWMSKPAPFSAELLLHFDRPGDSGSIRRIQRLSPIVIHERDEDETASIDNLAIAKSLNEAFMRIDRQATLWLAGRVLLKALQEVTWEVRYLLCWIALEALFGPDEPRETTFRISQRIAFFLTDSRSAAHDLFKRVKDGYGWRSRIAHGRRISKLTEERTVELSHEVELLVRDSLVRALLDPSLTARFDGSGREAFLDDLVFA